MEEVRIITTEDGSHSLYLPHLNETYHSFHGALQESRHVFIQMGLRHISNTAPNQVLNILEIGFGTGLNALLTLLETIGHGLSVHYHSLEPFPLPSAITGQLNYGEMAGGPQGRDYFQRLHEAPWNQDVQITDGFCLHKVLGKLEEKDLVQDYYHVVYFDAFAPNKQGELWEREVLNKVVQAMAPGGVFVTYCAKGQLKRDLKTLGLEVETLPGPPGKKEMVRATKPGAR
jgi:tRNA U34 5-methylaminomethyl-2-thiouridine-forming methyltransferase MnmC